MDEKLIDLYLLNEMSEEERQSFEDKFAADDSMFYEIAARENELVDRYAAGDLAGSERERFELSLAADPARRQKVANSKLLREFIANERENKTITIAERSGLFSRLAEFFAVRPLQLATSVLLIVFAIWSTYLLIDNRRLRSLDQELAAARGREAELSFQVENERETAGDLTAELDSERARVQKLEEEIAKLKPANTAPETPAAAPPTIATLVLSPIGIRGGPGMPQMKLASSVTRVSMVVDLTQETVERVSLKINGEAAGNNLQVRGRGAERSISFTLPVNRFKDGKNTIEVLDPNGVKLREYSFAVTRD